MFFWSIARPFRAAKLGRKYPMGRPVRHDFQTLQENTQHSHFSGNRGFLPQLKVSSLSSRNYKQIQFWQSPLGKIMLMELSKIPLLLSLFACPHPDPRFHSWFMFPCILQFHYILFSFKWAKQRLCFLWSTTFCL